MAPRNSNTPAEAPATALAVTPVVALCTVTYGKATTVAPGTIFSPVSESERDELFSLKAVRDLDDAEQALFARDGASAVTEANLNPEPAPIPESVSDLIG